ncbi:peptidoglycan linked protein (LPXTG) [Haloplasma contractile]|uniref:Peptidoglycan linked protein n=1 Tax=Haloplasma contractile SSD-17B TaxID=1033810 RepID=U2E9V9_9MOLU|nr:peptidoglycan linked protein (LPXTG) [Haloplasma contractile]ERJ11913.1 Peptidoglycan linked protein [Haloplasma contractile SSD-17B]
MVKKFSFLVLLSLLIFVSACGILDNTAPDISVKETFKTTYEVGASEPDWLDAVVVTDQRDGTITLTESDIDRSNVDMDTVGTFAVGYHAVDSRNNKISKLITITIQDTTAPVIVVDDTKKTTYEVGSDAPDWSTFVSVTDNYDDVITIDSTDTLNVDINTVGTFDVRYQAIDSIGNNSSETITVTIQDTIAPVITIDDTKMSTYGVGSDTPDWSVFVSVTDNYDDTIAIDRIDTATVDMNTVGTYDVIYYAVDSSGNEESETITFKVINDLIGDKTVEEWKAYYSQIIGIDENGNGTPDWQEQEMEIVYASHFFEDEDQYNTQFRNAQKWAAQYDNITVVRDQRFKKSAGYDFAQLQMLLTAASEGTMPDIFYSPLPDEVYDHNLSLDLTPYLRTDSEALYISQNAIDYMKSFDGLELYGIPFMSVSQMPAINVGLLREHNISVPSYDWTYEEYEALRHEVGALTDAGDQCIFPGIIDFSQHGPHYFDSIPNGWKGFNIETQRFDFESADGFGAWLEEVAYEGNQGWDFFYLEQSQIPEACQNVGWPWGDGIQAIQNMKLYSLNFDIDTFVSERGLDIDLYPMPEAPLGGQTTLPGYYDTFSLSYTLENDPIKAEAVFDLAKWLSYGEDGTSARWSLIDEDIILYGETYEAFIEAGGVHEDWPKVHPSTHLMDYISGWPITTNPNVIEHHPLVKGFPENSAFAVYNFDAFKNPEFQRQLSNPVAYPRQIPAVTKTYAHLNTWEIKEQIRLEGYTYAEIAGTWDHELNIYLDDYLRNYNE